MTMTEFNYRSPFSWLLITASDKGITALSFQNKKSAPTDKSQIVNVHLKNCVRQLDEYFSGKRTDFKLPLDTEGTKFQKKVWGALQKIPHGQTVSYQDIARRIRSPKASRAVGGANNKNPVAIIVPCHRVIGKNGDLVGYASGVNKKKWLLNHENAT